MAVATNTAGFVWTDGDGHEVVHRLQASLRFRSEAQYGRVQTRYRSFSLDQRTSETFTIAGGAEECTAMIRFDGDPFGLQELLAAGADGRTLTYRPNLAVNDEYALELMDYGTVAPASLDSGRFSFGEWEAPVRLRLMSGGSLESLVTDRLAFVTGAGPMRHATFTRATTGTRINRNRMIESIAVGDRRVTWVERDGVLRPAMLVERARTQLAADPQAPGSWANVGTPVTTGSQTDPFGGTTAVLVEDDDGSSREGRGTICSLSDGEQSFVVIARQGTLSGIRINVRDSDAGVNRHFVNVEWNGGVTPPTMTTSAGDGQLFDPVLIVGPDGTIWWMLPLTATGIVGGNANSLQVVGGEAASDTGTFFLAGGNAWNATAPLSWLGTEGARDDDEWSHPLPFAPQAFTGYVAFHELERPNFTGRRVVEIGNGTVPTWFAYKPAGGDGYRVLYNTGAATQSGALDLNPSYGDFVELFPGLDDNAAPTLHGRINGGAIQTATVGSSGFFPPSWSDPQLHIGGFETNNVGVAAFESIVLFRGALTPTQILRRLSSQGVS
jgi:hypothetical protein